MQLGRPRGRAPTQSTSLSPNMRVMRRTCDSSSKPSSSSSIPSGICFASIARIAALRSSCAPQPHHCLKHDITSFQEQRPCMCLRPITRGLTYAISLSFLQNTTPTPGPDSKARLAPRTQGLTSMRLTASQGNRALGRQTPKPNPSRTHLDADAVEAAATRRAATLATPYRDRRVRHKRCAAHTGRLPRVTA